MTEISCLQSCVLLEKLWIVENEVTSCRGLQKLAKLKELHLYSNNIGKIEGLEVLTNLEVHARVRTCKRTLVLCRVFIHKASAT